MLQAGPISDRSNEFALPLLRSIARLKNSCKQVAVLIALGLAALASACQSVPAALPTLTKVPAPSQTPSPVPTYTPEAVLQGTGPDRVEEGRTAYLDVCAVCHGSLAEGYANDQVAPALDSSEHASEHPDPQIHGWIINGKLGLGRQMPAYGDQLTDGEVHAIIAYLHTFWTEDQLRVQQDLGRRWPATPEPTWTPGP